MNDRLGPNAEHAHELAHFDAVEWSGAGGKKIVAGFDGPRA